jgi:hypothetical protein
MDLFLYEREEVQLFECVTGDIDKPSSRAGKILKDPESNEKVVARQPNIAYHIEKQQQSRTLASDCRP